MGRGDFPPARTRRCCHLLILSWTKIRSWTYKCLGTWLHPPNFLSCCIKAKEDSILLPTEITSPISGLTCNKKLVKIGGFQQEIHLTSPSISTLKKSDPDFIPTCFFPADSLEFYSRSNFEGTLTWRYRFFFFEFHFDRFETSTTETWLHPRQSQLEQVKNTGFSTRPDFLLLLKHPTPPTAQKQSKKAHHFSSFTLGPLQSWDQFCSVPPLDHPTLLTPHEQVEITGLPARCSTPRHQVAGSAPMAPLIDSTLSSNASPCFGLDTKPTKSLNNPEIWPPRPKYFDAAVAWAGGGVTS